MEDKIISDNNQSNSNAKKRWNDWAVGSQRSKSKKGTKKYFSDIEKYRYGYETPFIPRLLCSNVNNKTVLEIGVGNGIDGVTLVKNGANYSGIDITENHINLAKQNFINNDIKFNEFILNDLLNININKQYDIIYSFGVLHHIKHEKEYLNKIRILLNDKAELRIAVYSKYSFFNFYLFVTWIVNNKCKVSFNQWQGYISDGADFEYPITIKIRSKKEVYELYKSCGFEIISYHKRGFVQNYIPIFGKLFKPDGYFLNFMGSILGWYHIFILKKRSNEK
jgi:ubiquinone/menaquinone biosynthesis C-methylase UbiE